MVNVDMHNQRMRAKLSALAANVQEWKAAVDAVRPDCACVLTDRPGFQPFDNARCTCGRRCRAMTVLTIRTHMGMHQVNTRHLAAAQVPRMVADLAALFDELPGTTDWLVFAQRLQQIVTQGRDPDRDPAPTPRASAPTASPDPSHPSKENPQP